MPANVKPSSVAAFKWVAVTIGTIALATMVAFIFAYTFHNLESLWH